MIEREIRRLLDAPIAGDAAPSLATIEHTLTAGYARAMALEAEQSRLQRRLADLALAVAGAEEVEMHGGELKTLSSRVKACEHELFRLRELLSSLRSRAAAVRAA